MTSLVDFSNCPSFLSGVDGNARKERISYQNQNYILKYGDAIDQDANNPLQGSYNHAPLSEHIGCKIFQALGIPVQETILGIKNGHEVVACKDFMSGWAANADFAAFKELEHGMISESRRGRSPKLAHINEIIDNHPFLEGFRDNARDRYWETFIADAIIGNFDRHTGNWGYIAQTENRVPIKCVALAPVYDCGSSLYPRLAEEEMPAITNSPEQLRERALSFPKAKLTIDSKKNISYHDLMLASEGAQARAAYTRLADKIDALDIESIVNDVPGISDIRREFYIATVQSRIEHILEPARELAPHEFKTSLGESEPDGIEEAVDSVEFSSEQDEREME